MLHRLVNAKRLFTVALLIGTGILVYQTLGLSPTARLIPRAVVLPTLGLLLAQLIIDLKQHDAPGRVQEQDRQAERPALLWILAMPVLLYLAGFLLTMPLYLFLFLSFRSHLKRSRALLLAVGFSGLLYGLSTFVPQTRLYPGLLWTWLGV